MLWNLVGKWNISHLHHFSPAIFFSLYLTKFYSKFCTVYYGLITKLHARVWTICQKNIEPFLQITISSKFANILRHKNEELMYKYDDVQIWFLFFLYVVLFLHDIYIFSTKSIKFDWKSDGVYGVCKTGLSSACNLVTNPCTLFSTFLVYITSKIFNHEWRSFGNNAACWFMGVIGWLVRRDPFGVHDICTGKERRTRRCNNRITKMASIFGFSKDFAFFFFSEMHELNFLWFEIV